MWCAFHFYLYENQSDFLDKLDKLANVFIAIFTLLFSIYIFITTRKNEEKDNKSIRKIDFLKTIVLENNMAYFFGFHEEIISSLSFYRGLTLTSNDKIDISVMIIDKMTKYRYKFYDLLLPFDKVLYHKIKTNSDDLIDDLTMKINDSQYDFLSLSNFQSEIEDKIIESRNSSLTAILNFQ